MDVRTRIKICGLSRPEDIAVAIESGADAIGFVFYPPSPRAVSVEQAAKLAAALSPFVSPVGLFVDAARADIEAAIAAIPNLVLQFHGGEDAETCASFARPYLKALAVSPDVDLLDCSRRFRSASALLLDAPVDGYGGGGKVFDWSLVPRGGIHHRVVLSGGLHAGNVGSAIAALGPHAVDVSSGVESSRGVKDAEAIRRFCDAVREADSQVQASPT